MYGTIIAQAAAKLASPGSGGFERQELEQVGWEACLTDLPTTPGLTYVIARRRMIDAIRFDSKRRALSLNYTGPDGQGHAEGEARIDKPQHGAAGVGIPEEMLVDPRTTTHRTDDRIETLRQFGDTLKGRERNVWFLMVSDEPMTLEDLGKLHGVSKQRIQQIASKLRESARKFINSKEV